MKEQLKIYCDAKKAYYDGEPDISDEEFDALENDLRDAGYDLTIGYDDNVTSDNAKYTHRHKMLSLGKHQILEDTMPTSIAASIFEKYGEGRLSWKYDGLALELSYTKGKLTMISTRGSGFAGRNVFEKLKVLVPETIACGRTLDIRCEAIVPETLFNEKYASKGYSHSRNLASGIVRDENLNDSRLHDLYIIPLEVVSLDAKLEGMISEFTDMTSEFNILLKSEVQISSITELVSAYTSFLSRRKQQIFGSDGLVYTANATKIFEHNGKYPSHAVAIKFKPPRLISKITDITWTLHASGRYVPKIHFSPLVVDGRRISKATGHNLQNLIDNNLSIGTQVQVVLSNDIIPMVKPLA